MKLIVTFTNMQLVRNYLYDLECNFLNELKYEELLIICNDQTHNSLNRVINSYPAEMKAKIRLEKINFNFDESIPLKAVNFLSKCHVHSKFTIAKFFRSKSKREISTLNLILKLVLYTITVGNFVSVRLIRFFTPFFLRKTDAFKQLNFLSNYDLLLVLSLTDDLDILVTSFARLNNIKSIGTVRSWDNLTSHGLIRVKPDVFYCHSEAMAADLRKYQYYGCNSQNTVIGFSAWLNFGKINEIKSSSLKNRPKNEYRILYGAMGEYFNPGEEVFLTKLINFVQQDFNLDLVVLMHPKFLLSDDFQKQFDTKIEFDKFNFDNYHETRSYTKYLEYLSRFDLILSSGSTLLLDACIINKNIAHVNFEICRVPYWESIKRYSDFREYYKSFLELSNTPVLSSFEKLAFKIQNRSSLTKLSDTEQESASKFFMGSPTQLSLSDLVNNQL
jgi:hypothetical protein